MASTTTMLLGIGAFLAASPRAPPHSDQCSRPNTHRSPFGISLSVRGLSDGETRIQNSCCVISTRTSLALSKILPRLGVERGL